MQEKNIYSDNYSTSTNAQAAAYAENLESEDPGMDRNQAKIHLLALSVGDDCGRSGLLVAKFFV